MLRRDARPRSPYYETMQVCLNGHRITACYDAEPERRRDFCDVCGASTIHNCPNCAAPIRGAHVVPGVDTLGHLTPVPGYCHNCGEAYPWVAGAEMQNQQGYATPQRLGATDMVELILKRFHRVVKQLERRHESRATLKLVDEYDVQDLLHALLLLHFEDVRPEEWTPSYAGGASRMDFLLKDEKIVVEVKCSRPSVTDRVIGDQLLVDIERYKVHPDCHLLYCFVYDPDERIHNPRALERDLSREPDEDDALAVRVLVTPKR